MGSWNKEHTPLSLSHRFSCAPRDKGPLLDGRGERCGVGGVNPPPFEHLQPFRAVNDVLGGRKGSKMGEPRVC